MTDLLNVSGLTKRFRGKSVLDAVHFSVRRGEVLGLIGPNGAGKTTLFECLAGLMPADVGEIKYDGASLGTRNRSDVLFYLPDSISPWAEQTVDWVLKFFEAVYQQPAERLHDLREPLRLSELRNSRIANLSKGERKRVLLALGLLTPHSLLLLDEPFDGLDLRQTRDVMKLVRAESERGRTLMLSIHQLLDAGRVCDRLVLLNNGKMAGEGDLATLRTQAGLADGGLEEIFLALT